MNRNRTHIRFLLVFALLLLAAGSTLAQSRVAAKPAPVRRDLGPIFNPGAMSSFFRRLASVEARNNSRPVVIMQYGDSHTKADLFTGEVRRNLQSQFSRPGELRPTVFRPGASASDTIVFQPLGVNGARAKKMGEMTESEAFLRSIGQRNPDLIILAYGTNEVTDEDWTVDSYARLFTDIVNRCHAAAPTASILIMGPPDRAVAGAGGWASARRMPALIEAQRQAAYRAGAAYWSASEAMGGDGSMNVWNARGLTQPDHVHFTAPGYYRLGDLFFNDLMATYRGNGATQTPRWSQTEAPRKRLSDADMKLMQGVPITAENRY